MVHLIQPPESPPELTHMGNAALTPTFTQTPGGMLPSHRVLLCACLRRRVVLLWGIAWLFLSRPS